MRRYTAIINPISGGGRAAAAWEPVARRLLAEGASVGQEFTRDAEHAVALAAEVAKRGDVAVAVGGDGLVRDVTGGVTRHGGVMGIVPAGRGNDLAAHLGVGGDADTLARTLLAETTRPIDVLDVDGVIVPGNAYIGIDSLATRIINDSRWVPALLLYRLAPVRAMLAWRAARYTVTIDGDTRTVSAHTVVVAGSGAYGHGLRIVPPASLDDGLAHVMVVGDGPRRKIVKFMSQAKHGTHVDRSDVDIRTGSVVTIDADRPVPVCGDGDEIGRLPVTIKVRPKALSVIVPA